MAHSPREPPSTSRPWPILLFKQQKSIQNTLATCKALNRILEGVRVSLYKLTVVRCRWRAPEKIDAG